MTQTYITIQLKAAVTILHLRQKFAIIHTVFPAEVLETK